MKPIWRPCLVRLFMFICNNPVMLRSLGLCSGMLKTILATLFCFFISSTNSVYLCIKFWHLLAMSFVPKWTRIMSYPVTLCTHLCILLVSGPLWVRGCRIGPTYPASHKRRLIGGSLFAVGCDPCQWKRGSWLLSQFFVAALRRQYTALASISLSRKVKMAWLNQSAGSAKP